MTCKRCDTAEREARITRAALNNLLKSCVNSRGEICGNLTRTQMHFVHEAALALMVKKETEK